VVGDGFEGVDFGTLIWTDWEYPMAFWSYFLRVAASEFGGRAGDLRCIKSEFG